MDRHQAFDLLCEYTKGDSLRKHALAVEAAMRACATKYGGDPDLWGIVGLLHDFDYEMYPQFPDHPTRGSEILKERGIGEDARRAILGHVPAMNVPRDTAMARALFACDELCGFVMACAMVRPTKLSGLEPPSVRKKMKDKAFARGVRREDIVDGAAELGAELNDHIGFVIAALATVAADLGLS